MSLVLTLNPGQRVYIGDDIEIWCRPHRGTQIKMAIKAPKEIFVKRAPKDDKSDEFLFQEGRKSGSE